MAASSGLTRRTWLGGALAAVAVPATVRADRVELPSLGPLGLARRLPLLDGARAALDRLGDAIPLRDRIGIADFGVVSRNLRLHVVDLVGGARWSYLVAHGRGSDPEHTGWLQSFSNDMGSLATSRGAYATGEEYVGVHGRSLRLTGLDPDDSNAVDRAIVLHGAEYVTENHIATWGKCGRSEGCFAVAPQMLATILTQLGPGRLLFADRA